MNKITIVTQVIKIIWWFNQSRFCEKFWGSTRWKKNKDSHHFLNSKLDYMKNKHFKFDSTQITQMLQWH